MPQFESLVDAIKGHEQELIEAIHTAWHQAAGEFTHAELVEAFFGVDPCPEDKYK